MEDKKKKKTNKKTVEKAVENEAVKAEDIENEAEAEKLISEENEVETEASEEKETKKKKETSNKSKKKTQASKAIKKSKEKRSLKEFLKSRKARYGAVAVLIVVITVAVVIVLNVIVGLLVDRFPNLKVDFTNNKAFELNEDTVDYLSHLDKDVTVYILSAEENFINGGEYFVQAKNLLEKMESCSDGKLTVEYIDTTTNPAFLKKYSDVEGTTKKYVAIVECGDQYKALTLEDCFDYDQETYSYSGEYKYTATKIEQAVVTAVLNVTTENKVVVDIIKGNQESDYSALQTLLSDNAYQVNEVSLLTSKLDEDAKFVIVFAPAVDYDETTIKKLSDWLENGGKYGRTLIYVPSEQNTNTPNLYAFLDEWKLTLSEGYVFETSQDHVVKNAYTFITDYTDYYTENLKNPKIPVVTRLARGITIKDENTAHSLLDTSDKAGIEPYEHDNDWDYKEAITGEKISVAAESVKSGNDSESRVVVFGSSIMFSSDFLSHYSYNNSAFIMNVFNTISGNEDVGVVIESKPLNNTELGVTDTSSGTLIVVVFVVLLPLTVLVLGLVLWIRRRNK